MKTVKPKVTIMALMSVNGFRRKLRLLGLSLIIKSTEEMKHFDLWFVYVHGVKHDCIDNIIFLDICTGI